MRRCHLLAKVLAGLCVTVCEVAMATGSGEISRDLMHSVRSREISASSYDILARSCQKLSPLLHQQQSWQAGPQ